MPEQVKEAPAVLPDASAECPSPHWIGVEALHMPVIQIVQPLPGFDGPGNENEVEAVHKPPVFMKNPLLVQD